MSGCDRRICVASGGREAMTADAGKGLGQRRGGSQRREKFGSRRGGRAAAPRATGGRPRATAARRTSLVNDFRICGYPSGMVNPFWYRLDMMDANAK